MSKVLFNIGDDFLIENDQPLTGNDFAPPIKNGEVHRIINIHLDKGGNQHLDLGLKSELNYVSSYETQEELPNSGKGGIHWVHPSRGKKV